MQLKTLYAVEGETLKVTNEWAAQAEKRGTTVASSAWEFTGVGSLANESLSDTTASALLTPMASGELRNTATLANGEVLIAWRRVEVD